MDVHQSADKPGKTVVHIGKISMAPDVQTILANAGVSLEQLIERHRVGDWGTVDDFDQEYQDWAAAQGKTVTSTFIVWIEGKARSVFISTEEETTYVVLA